MRRRVVRADLVRHGADQRVAIGHLRQARQVLADPRAGDASSDGPEVATHLGRHVGLQVPRIQLPGPPHGTMSTIDLAPHSSVAQAWAASSCGSDRPTAPRAPASGSLPARDARWQQGWTRKAWGTSPVGRWASWRLILSPVRQFGFSPQASRRCQLTFPAKSGFALTSCRLAIKDPYFGED